jgi:hypothetical protein
MGVPCVTDPFMVAKMEKICQDIRDSEFMSRDKQMRLIEVFDRFVRAGIRNYLIYSTDDIDQGKKLQGYDLFGQMIEAGNPASAKKKKKAAEQSVRSSVTLLANEFPLAERDFSKEKQEQVKEIATRVQTKILEMRTEKYPSELNEKLYPILSFPSIAAMNERPSEEILSFPTIIDYVNGFNFILLAEQLRLESQTLLEQELERKRKEQEEIARIEAQKRAEEIASRAKAAAARAALEAERKERIRLLLLAKNGQTPKEPRKHNKVKFSEMQTLGIGKTHQSCCHESREVLDAAYSKSSNQSIGEQN